MGILNATLKNSGNIRIGQLVFQVAPFLVAGYTEAQRIDLNPTTSKFTDVGLIDPNSVNPDFSIEKLEIKGGLPGVILKRYIIGRAGKVDMVAREYSPLAVEIATGRATTKTLGTETTVSASPAPTTTGFTVAAIGLIAVDGWVQITYAASGKIVDAQVKSIATNAITLYDALEVAPASGDKVRPITMWRNSIGGTSLTELVGRLVFSDTEGKVAILYLPHITPDANFKPAFGGGEKEATLPMAFDCEGFRETLDGEDAYWLCHQYLIPKA